MAIANSDGSIVLSTKVDQSGLKKGMSTMKSGTSALSGAFSKLGGVIAAAFSVKVLIDFSKEASNLATQTEASVQRLIDIYGSASQAVGDFIDANANALGMSKAAAASYASVYGNLFSVWADQQTNAALTTQYLNMTAVVASKTGRTVEDVQERVRSGLLGNTEAIEDLGIFVNVKAIEMTDAFKRMANGQSWEQLDNNTQQQIRSMAIIEQATAKYGDEVANTTALTKSQFQAAFQDFQATWGQVVNRVLTPVLKTLTEILNVATMVIQKLFNISSSTISQGEATEDQTKKQEELTEAVEDTEKAAKKTLAPFDDLKILSTPEKSQEQPPPTEIPPTEIPNPFGNMFDYEQLASQITGFVEKAKSLFSPLSKWVSEELAPSIAGSFGSMFGSIETFFVEFEEPLSDFYEDTIKPIVEDIGDFVTQIIDEIGSVFDTISENMSTYSYEITAIIDTISVIIQLLWSFISPIIKNVIAGIGNILRTGINFIFKIISSVGSFFSFIGNFFKGIKALLEGNTEDAIKYAKQALADFVNIFVGIGNAIIDILNLLCGSIFNGVQGFINGLGSLIGKIGDFLGQDDWGWNWDAKAPLIPYIPKWVPKLAKGAVIPGNREFLAVLGDQPAGQTNIEAPAELIKQMVMEAMIEMGGNAKSGNTEVVLEIDGREFGRAIVEQGNRESRRIGTRMVFS